MSLPFRIPLPLSAESLCHPLVCTQISLRRMPRADSSSCQIARQQLDRGGEGDVRGGLWPAIDERALSAMAVRGSTLRGRGAACELDGGGWEVVDKHSIEHSYAIERMTFRRRTTTCRAPPLPCPPARAPRADMSLPCRIPPSLSAESPRHPLVCTSNRLRSSAEVLQAPARGGEIGGAQAGRLEHAVAAGLAAGTGADKSLAAADGGAGGVAVGWLEFSGAPSARSLPPALATSDFRRHDPRPQWTRDIAVCENARERILHAEREQPAQPPLETHEQGREETEGRLREANVCGGRDESGSGGGVRGGRTGEGGDGCNGSGRGGRHERVSVRATRRARIERDGVRNAIQ